MQHDRVEIEALLEANVNDLAIEMLIADGAPEAAWKFALLARAYRQRGDSRGDLFSSHFFAQQALAAGCDEAWLEEIIAHYNQSAPQREVRPCAYIVGGMTDRRAPGPSPYTFSAVSVMAGEGRAPKDYDWSARNVPCQEACPAKTDIPAYLSAIYDGEYEKAYRINLESNVFPGVLGRVCARPCEAECRHGWDGLGQPVAICFSKRAAAQLHSHEPVVLDKWFPPREKTVAVIGAGVAGLTAARELARCGHRVMIYEKHERPGGMLNQGIPVFRLPREVIDVEIDQVRAMGVEITCGAGIGRELPLAELLGRYDAVVMAAGTLRPNLLDLPGKELEGVRHGLDFLLEANERGTATVGRHVVVIGGGFTGMDCARTAKRIGAAALDFGAATPRGETPGSVMHAPPDHVKIWYRRTEQEMLITPGELEELAREGIAIEFLVTPVAYLGAQGKLTGVRFIRTRLGTPDASGRRRPVRIAGSEFDVAADTVLLATGQFPDTSWIDPELKERLVQHDGRLANGAGQRTAIDKLFVAGDFALGASSLINAIGHAKQTAYVVDEYLTGRRRLEDLVMVEDADETDRIREMDAVPMHPMPMVEPSARMSRTEVETGYTHELAVDETQRCYRCDYKYEIDADKCIYCDWCIKAKPRPECILRVKELHYDDEGRVVGWEQARSSDETYLIWINQYDCIRCGACVTACPVDAISLQKVSLRTVQCKAARATEGELNR
jgi:NADPH-dependent glutamate synthase beta subunit-like oxidoreductase/ferredoxin